MATGTTPMGLYAELATRRSAGLLDTGAITAVQLDEYLGLEPDDRRSLFGWMRRSFLEPLAIDDARVVRLPLDGDLDDACAAFDRGLEARGGIDLAILGLGHDGHLGFNEPPADRWAPTRAVTLTDVTIEANARYWGDVADVPTRAVTIGPGPAAVGAERSCSSCRAPASARSCTGRCRARSDRTSQPRSCASRAPT